MKTLEAKKRDMAVSTDTLRSEGIIPVIIYGKGMDNISATVMDNAVRSIWADIRDTKMLTLDLAGTTYSVLMKDMQTHPVSGQILHIDFLVQA